MNTRIEWTHPPGYIGVTWNPVTGCSKISEGCANCYARRMAKRLAGRCGYPQDEPFKLTWHQHRLTDPLDWPRSYSRHAEQRPPGRPRFCFVCSMGDLFQEGIPFDHINKIWHVMLTATLYGHLFIVLTKRAERMANFFKEERHPWPADKGPHWASPNIWLGVTAENQRAADKRIPHLLDTPAAVRFVSVEPMLGAVDLSAYLSRLSWCIVGAETGPGARPMNLDWARSLRDQCYEAHVPFFFKQAGRKGTPIPDDLMVREWPTQVTREAHTG